MRVKTGRTWSENSPRRGEALEAATFQFRDGEIRGSIEGSLVSAAGPVRGLSAIGQRSRTAGVDRPRYGVVR